ncbi:MAG: hypothetical protein IID59_12035 [Proteobacteria bacterium]|nr:hypothetical protein [Pseudomonadota bacterium]
MAANGVIAAAVMFALRDDSIAVYWAIGISSIGAAVRAEQIGQAMFEVSARGPEFENGDRLGTWNIMRYSDAYDRRSNVASISGSWTGG